MWEAFKRVIKPRGAIVLTASGKFTYKLVMSNFEWFKYEWVVEKLVPTGHLDAPRKPLNTFENVLIFADKLPKYYPQLERGKGYNVMSRSPARAYSKYKPMSSINSGSGYYPRNIIRIKNLNYGGKYHPTQKPVALFEYLIRTYTQAGEVVFDPCVGSGTTAIAARNTGRNFKCGDSSEEYVQVARERLAKPYTLPMFEEAVTEEEPVQSAMEL